MLGKVLKKFLPLGDNMLYVIPSNHHDKSKEVPATLLCTLLLEQILQKTTND